MSLAMYAAPFDNNSSNMNSNSNNNMNNAINNNANSNDNDIINKKRQTNKTQKRYYNENHDQQKVNSVLATIHQNLASNEDDEDSLGDFNPPPPPQSGRGPPGQARAAGPSPTQACRPGSGRTEMGGPPPPRTASTRGSCRTRPRTGGRRARGGPRTRARRAGGRAGAAQRHHAGQRDGQTGGASRWVCRVQAGGGGAAMREQTPSSNSNCSGCFIYCATGIARNHGLVSAVQSAG